MEFSKEAKENIQALLKRYPQGYRKAALLPVLRLAQEEFGNTSFKVARLVAEELELPLGEVAEVISFYSLFYPKAPGQFHIQFCHSISCTLMGVEKLIRHTENKLGIRCGQTTDDGIFALSRVECTAACGEGPMLQLNDEYIGKLTSEKIDNLIEKCRNGKKDNH